jgi:hypothetical protein
MWIIERGLGWFWRMAKYWRDRVGITIPLHTDRIKLVGEFERLLAAGERGR